MRPIIVTTDKATVRRVYRALVLAGAVGLTCLVASCGASTTVVPSTQHTARKHTTTSVAAEAQCAAWPLPKHIRNSSAVFVGLVTDTHARGYQATVTVEEVWFGHVPQQVHVAGGPAPPPTGARSAIWRRFTVGKRYLFMTPAPIHGDTVQADQCSGTRLFKQR